MPTSLRNTELHYICAQHKQEPWLLPTRCISKFLLTCPPMCHSSEEGLWQAATPVELGNLRLLALAVFLEKQASYCQSQITHEVHCLCCLLWRAVFCRFHCPQDFDDQREAQSCKESSTSRRSLAVMPKLQQPFILLDKNFIRLLPADTDLHLPLGL